MKSIKAALSAVFAAFGILPEFVRRVIQYEKNLRELDRVFGDDNDA